ncbi:hypothetical protein CKO32_01570 [Afifella marina DSM 2698]|nr:hypothetical protein [Afifella marina DSM 2698]MBK1628370.1 hypothetical protein [Afifella marina]MBK5919029.1 hypothetical protein [Afifella marina]RAI20232.1 hypothetical protein CH311_10425 [Afifella marina DSM 2698]
MHKLKVLLQAPPSEQNRVGFRFNQEVIELTAPYAFGRTTQVFDLSARKFPFGAGRFASYRVPFFFVEKGVVKVCYLQTRKGPYLTAEDYGGMAAVHSRYLMAQEFYGEKIDVEYVDVGATIEGGPRERRRLTLANLDIWPADRLADHLNVVAEALVAIEARGVAPKRRRPLKDAELPLFD